MEVVILPQLIIEAPVAQLDRASVYGTEGYRSESCRVHWDKSHLA